MKTHFAQVELGNESSGQDEWNDPLCGSYSENMENDWKLVTCKKCLNLKERYEQEMKRHMEHSCENMAQFVEFMKTEK